MSRGLKFFIAIAIGLAAGLVYGWVVSPVQYTNTSPDTLRVDYRTDYILMTAEVFSADHDVDAAARRLAKLGSTQPVQIATLGLQYALQNGYPPADLSVLRDLVDALQTWQPAGGNSP